MFDFFKKIKKKATDVLGGLTTKTRTTRDTLERVVPKAVRRSSDVMQRVPQTVVRYREEAREIPGVLPRVASNTARQARTGAAKMPELIPKYQQKAKRAVAPVQRTYGIAQNVMPKVSRTVQQRVVPRVTQSVNALSRKNEQAKNAYKAAGRTAWSDFTGNINALKRGELAQRTAKKMERVKFLQPSTTGKVRVRDFVRELPVGVQETGKGILRESARVALSAKEAPRTLITGRASGQWYNTPLGRINSLQSEAQNRVRRGDSPAKAIANTTLDLFLGAGDIAGALKPAMHAAKTLPLVPKEAKNIADDLTRGLKSRMDWKSSLMQGMSHPGMTVKSTKPKNYQTPAGTRKDVMAKNIVNKQIASQAQGASRAEKGFVAPRSTPLIPQKQINKYYKNAYKVATNQKDEAVVGMMSKQIKEIPEKVYLRSEAYQSILKKHQDDKNFDFNKALRFVKTINIPDEYASLKGQQRINLLKKINDKFDKTYNIVGAKPIVKDNKTFVTTSFLTNKEKEVRRLLSEGRPVPSSREPMARVGGRLAHLDNNQHTSYNKSNTQQPKNQAEWRGGEQRQRLVHTLRALQTQKNSNGSFPLAEKPAIPQERRMRSVGEYLAERQESARVAAEARRARSARPAPKEITELFATKNATGLLDEVITNTPDWVPHNVRSKHVFDEVRTSMETGTMPISAPARRLYTMMVGEAAYRSGYKSNEWANMATAAMKAKPDFPKAQGMVSPRTFALQQEKKRLLIPKELKGMGFTKKELERKGVDEIARLTKLKKLGYKKDDVAKMDFDRMDLIINNGVQKYRLDEYYKKKHALDTHFLSGIPSNEIRDISPIGTGWKDVYRNMQRAFGKHYGTIKSRLLDPFDNAKMQFVRDQGNELHDVNEYIVKTLGITKGSKMSRYVQLFGEKKFLDHIAPSDLTEDAKRAIDFDALVTLARGNKKALTQSVARVLEDHPDIKEDVILRQLQRVAGNKWENVVKADQWFRKKYSELLTSLNKVCEENFPTHPLYPESTKIIPERENYYRHFRDSSGWTGLKNLFETPASIDPALAATSDVTNPKTRWLSFAQRRTGDKTDYDAVGGYLDYIRNWSYAKNIDPFIQKFKGVDDELKDVLPPSTAKTEMARVGLAEELAQKTSPLQQIADSTDPAEIRTILMDNGMSERQAEWMSKELAQVTDYDYVTRWIADKTRNNSDDIMGKISRQEAYADHSENRLNNFMTFLKNYSRDLAGKTNPIDRPFQENVFGRKLFRIFDFANSRFKTNAVVGNLSSTLAQVFNVPQGVAQAGARNASRAIPSTMRSLWRNDGASAQSRFLTERYFDGYAAFDEGILHNTKKFALWTTMVGDKVGTMYIWNSLHRKALADGVADPIRYADDWTRRMVAGRGVGEVPIAQKSRITQIVIPFQLEVTNMWYALADIVRHSPNGINIAKKLVEFSVAAAIMNGVTRRIRGSDVSFDPIGALIDTYGEYQDDEGLGTNTLQAAGRLGGEVLSNFPGGQTIASIYPEYGGNAFGFEFPTRKKFFGEGDPTRFGTGGLPVVAAAQHPLTRIGLPYGGRQVEKTLAGMETLMRGHAETKKGAVKTPVERNIPNVLRGLMFGPNATTEMQEYNESGQKPLGEMQSEKYKKMGMVDALQYFDSVMADREAKKERSDNKATGLMPTVDATGGSLPEEMMQLSNGKIYVPSIDQEFFTQRAAEIGIAKNALAMDPARNFVDMGDTVLRKSAAGNISSMTKDEYHSSLYTAQLTSAQKAKDYARWIEVAEKQMDTLIRMIDDPNVDALDKVAIQNKIDTLTGNISKYAGYGGRFTKGRSAAATATNARYSAQLTNAKNKGNFKAWLGIAENSIAELERQLTDPSITDTKALQIENKIVSLQNQRDRYIAQGGFMAPKKQKEMPREFRYRLVDPVLDEVNGIIAGYKARAARARRSVPLMPRISMPPRVTRKIYS